MISAHQNMPEISVNYFCVENNSFIVALCNICSFMDVPAFPDETNRET